MQNHISLNKIEIIKVNKYNQSYKIAVVKIKVKIVKSWRIILVKTSSGSKNTLDLEVIKRKRYANIKNECYNKLVGRLKDRGKKSPTLINVKVKIDWKIERKTCR